MKTNKLTFDEARVLKMISDACAAAPQSLAGKGWIMDSWPLHPDREIVRNLQHGMFIYRAEYNDSPYYVSRAGELALEAVEWENNVPA